MELRGKSVTEESRGPAAIENLDAILPEVKPEKPEPSAKRGSLRDGKISAAKTPAHEAVHRARGDLWLKSRQQNKAGLYGTAATYDFVHDRLRFALGSDDPTAAIARLQASLSLLTWELGEILKDIDAFEDTNKKAKK